MKSLLLLLVLMPIAAGAQTISQRGFAEGLATWYPQEAPNDPTHLVADMYVREEVFFKPAPWVQFAAGIDFRANSHDQVEEAWRVDYSGPRPSPSSRVDQAPVGDVDARLVHA